MKALKVLVCSSAFVFSMLFLLSCDNAAENQNSMGVTVKRDLINGTGTVTYIDLEGDFYGIIDDIGAKYDPVDLSNQYCVDGLRVLYTLRPIDGAGFHMWASLSRLSLLNPLLLHRNPVIKQVLYHIK